ncbi:MAG TPA: hypothetical protein EYP36_05255, partial [Calditrichaeota bacterium]|nr:hypothetical protein [Calditrichota bacterium]
MKEDRTFTEIMFIIVKHRYAILKQMVIFSIIAAVILLAFFPNWYRGTVQVMLPESQGFNFSTLIATIPFKDVLAPNMASTNLDNMAGVIESRTVMDQVIKKFRMDSVYEFEGDYHYEDLLATFHSNVELDLKYDQNIITLSFYDTDPKRAAAVANYYIKSVDSLINHVYSKKAHGNRIFLEKQVARAEAELDSLSELMQKFQSKTHLLVVPEQLQVMVENIGKLYADLTQYEIMRNVYGKIGGKQNVDYERYRLHTEELQKKLEELVQSETQKKSYPISLRMAPTLVKRYYELYRDIMIREKVLEVLYPQYEQAKLEEQKAVPNVLILDYAVPASKKSYPKRSLYVLLVAGLVFIFSSAWFLLEEKYKKLT